MTKMNPLQKSNLDMSHLDLSNTERLILTYIKSHPPEECMLDKITMGISRSRATILKYLEILYAKDILNYKFVGRSKLWYLKETPGESFSLMNDINGEISKAEIIPQESEMVSKASRLHNLILDELKTRKILDRTENIIFTVDNNLDIVAYNERFKTIFTDKKDLNDILTKNQRLLISSEINSLVKGKKIIELDLEEKIGIFRPYTFQISPLLDDKKNKVGTVFIGNEVSEAIQTKKELETLLFIARVAGSAENEEQLMKEVSKGINEIIPFESCSIILKDLKKNSDRFYWAYKMPKTLFNGEIPSFLKLFVKKSIDARETMSEAKGEYYLEATKSHMGNNSLNLMLSIPIIDEDQAVGAILLLSKLKSVNSSKLENVEMAADEIAGYLKLQRIKKEKEEFANTLLAMNQVSNIINSTENEDEMLEKSVKSTIESLDFDMGCIYLNDDKEDLALRVQKNLPENLRRMCVAGMFKDLFSKMFEKQNLVYITPESPDYDSLDPALYSSGVKTLLILPIKTGNEIIGLLNMGSHQIKTYNEVSLENLSSIGLQLGLALERSKMALKLKSKE